MLSHWNRPWISLKNFIWDLCVARTAKGREFVSRCHWWNYQFSAWTNPCWHRIWTRDLPTPSVFLRTITFISRICIYPIALVATWLVVSTLGTFSDRKQTSLMWAEANPGLCSVHLVRVDGFAHNPALPGPPEKNYLHFYISNPLWLRSGENVKDGHDLLTGSKVVVQNDLI